MGDPVADAVRVYLVDAGQDVVDAPAIGLFVLRTGGCEDNAGSIQVVDLIEGDVFFLHLSPDGIYRLDAVGEGVFQTKVVEQRFDRGCEGGEEQLVVLFGFVHQVLEPLVFFRVVVFQAEVLEFLLDVVEPQAIGDGCIERHCFGGYAFLFFCRKRFQCAHIMQSVGYFDQNDTNVVGNGEKKVAEIFSLFFRSGD